ncbi:Metallo-hydrolase/oxidoreductase [Crassisporium funariophilum]|nr:Metallo-hydrolase/oxidoreductase [Crassisporium funariophilum]
MATVLSLPAPSANQAFCDVSALEAGLIDLPDEMFITEATPGNVTTAPSLSFLLSHSENGQKFVFDLGIRKDWENYPPQIVSWIENTYKVDVAQNVVESLAKGGTSPTDIAYVCLSHCHWDHTGDTHPFTTSTFVVGGACQRFFQPGYPQDPEGRFASDLLPQGRTRFLDTTDWKPIGPFPRALDFYGDGSLYIIDAPGHLSGHVNALVRTSSNGAWIYLAGDSAHHWNLITGDSNISVGHGGHVHGCAHEDKDAAEEHIKHIKSLWKMPGVQVLLAHDEPWYAKNKGGSQFWPGKIQPLTDI